ncbi:hypothetical protein BC827DRAFT_1154631 [Russula dissimulans]|nr:hypothetical protein BC827DRAFT_1154631 [Russula dissimulans]
MPTAFNPILDSGLQVRAEKFFCFSLCWAAEFGREENLTPAFFAASAIPTCKCRAVVAIIMMVEMTTSMLARAHWIQDQARHDFANSTQIQRSYTSEAVEIILVNLNGVEAGSLRNARLRLSFGHLQQPFISVVKLDAVFQVFPTAPSLRDKLGSSLKARELTQNGENVTVGRTIIMDTGQEGFAAPVSPQAWMGRLDRSIPPFRELVMHVVIREDAGIRRAAAWEASDDA